MAELYQLRVVLCGVSPLVWRRLLIASETSIAQLHEILQLVFDWSDEHFHRFRIHGKDYGSSRLGGLVFAEDAESSSNLGVRRLSLEPGTAGTIVERVHPIRYSAPWSWSAAVGARLAASRASASLSVGSRTGAPPLGSADLLLPVS